MMGWLFTRLRAYALLGLAPFAIRSRHRQRFLNPALGRAGAGPADPYVAAMRDALRYNPFLFTCLERAGALHRLLHGHGYASVLRIGVKPAASGIAAHAWVEYPPGTPLLDEEHQDFGVLGPPSDMLR